VQSLLRTVPAGFLAAAVILSAAACGSAGSGASGASQTPAASPLAGLTADQIAQQALKDLRAASSVQISGRVPSQQGNVAFDITDVAPATCKGTIVLTPTAASAGTSESVTIGIIQVHGIAYLKPSRSYLEYLHAPAWMYPEVNGKYIKSTSDAALADMSKVCDLQSMVGLFTQGGTGFVKASSATFGGRAALILNQPYARPANTMYVSDSATPQFLDIQQTAEPGVFIDFDNFNAPVAIAAPPAANIAKVTGGESLD